MTQEEKELLFIDLCARLPYGVMVKQGNWKHTLKSVNMYNISFDSSCAIPIPYLRPMSSMTEEEKKVVCSMNMISDTELNDRLNYQKMYLQNYTIETFDYFNEHHLDYRGLIPMGLALEAKEGMYKTE